MLQVLHMTLLAKPGIIVNPVSQISLTFFLIRYLFLFLPVTPVSYNQSYLLSEKVWFYFSNSHNMLMCMPVAAFVLLIINGQTGAGECMPGQQSAVCCTFPPCPVPSYSAALAAPRALLGSLTPQEAGPVGNRPHYDICKLRARCLSSTPPGKIHRTKKPPGCATGGWQERKDTWTWFEGGYHNPSGCLSFRLAPQEVFTPGQCRSQLRCACLSLWSCEGGRWFLHHTSALLKVSLNTWFGDLCSSLALSYLWQIISIKELQKLLPHLSFPLVWGVWRRVGTQKPWVIECADRFICACWAAHALASLWPPRQQGTGLWLPVRQGSRTQLCLRPLPAISWIYSHIISWVITSYKLTVGTPVSSDDCSPEAVGWVPGTQRALSNVCSLPVM